MPPLLSSSNVTMLHDHIAIPLQDGVNHMFFHNAILWSSPGPHVVFVTVSSRELRQTLSAFSPVVLPF